MAGQVQPSKAGARAGLQEPGLSKRTELPYKLRKEKAAPLVKGTTKPSSSGKDSGGKSSEEMRKLRH